MSRVSPLRLSTTAGLALGVAATGLVLAPNALAGDTLPTPTVADPVVEIGEGIVLSGTGCFAPEGATHPADVYYAGETSWLEGSAQARPDGTWTLLVSMYVEMDPGTYVIPVNCDYYTAGGEYPPVTVTVVPAGWVPPAAAPTPGTGAVTSTPTATPTGSPTGSAGVTTPATGTVRGAAHNTPGVSSPDTGASTGDRSAPGARVVKVLRGFQPFEEVTVTLHSDPWTAGVFRADAQGVVTVSFTVPAGTPHADHTLVYEGDGGTYFQETLTVGAPTAGTDPASLAYTGAGVALPLGLGAGTLALGGGLVLLARRRSAGAAEAPQA
ncbi:hypothetical protein SAMN05660464_1284 [Geodermatophilus dictyosporus]|uniref:Gram-positive cocci surface proteins LPxTG domain-containing protein n=1 Tax=Geodermatophilus dictyosporus TaxID=1523247 RepID=A0A1I5KN22_9ACTN|nr:hypothetical protein [Geodermatophilus dictyosporus]SFO85941.1 hypothetical protein SAMN05660464_1284 [Geodermatophilus dictyosporus]